jgi:hypothetical protein
MSPAGDAGSRQLGETLMKIPNLPDEEGITDVPKIGAQMPRAAVWGAEW